MSRLASIFTCLLALLVASPLCCCAAELRQEQGEKSFDCCCGGGKNDKQKPDHDCACAKNDPRESPDVPLIPPPHAASQLSFEPASVWLPLALQSDLDLSPAWVPSVPWHAPPSLRRALLVSRTL
ncbi:hypothetical protein OJ996_06645 [Luteolibacter sp. GHJ8]|uniref:Uncharacterized protein n=1 Tax=Luteolibacter rhizosphaerae TaxID=2989719 RepID=A0ABT3G074_9BACT|nr:hypothetical protein [Luteolibacter rhizosphaerae]MCW1913241.1 hypothetical protein [Luteolibacter rhizosphaerae]